MRKFFSRIVRWQITKRQKLVVMAFVLSIVLLTTQIVSESLRYQAMGVLALMTLLFALFALWGELSGIKYFVLLLLPIYFAMGATLFYFLLPVRWLTRLPFATLFGISVYLLMLTSNIYNVASIRTIALLRAAHAVGLLFSLVATFFLTNVLFSLHLPFYFLALGVLVITGPLYLVGLWSYELEDFISRKVFLYASVYALVTVQIATVIAFWPIVPINAALVMATVMYVLLGFSQYQFANRLKRRIVVEHVSIAAFVFLVILISTQWS